MKNNYLIPIFIIFLAIIIASTKSQMKMPDDKELNHVYLEDLCVKLNESKDYILLDVRSAGEFSDTSQYTSLNLGRFRNSVNIDVKELENKLSEIEDHKNKPVFVYCSHSNRSRIASKILIDAGFTQVYNVNGGISEYLFDNIKCPEGFYVNSLPYKLYSPEVCREIIRTGDAEIIDIRSTAEFLGMETNEYRNIGRLQGAVNIPYNELEQRLNEIPRNKQIILYDFDNSFAPKAAAMLMKNGYSDVGILLYGLYSWIYKFGSSDTFLENTPEYKITDYLSTLKLITDSQTVLLDVRSTDEYNNKNKMEHFNLGHFKGSINIPADEIHNRIEELKNFKDKAILVYGNIRESKAPDVCKLLLDNGFKKVINASAGYYKFIWNSKNIKNYDLPEGIIVNP